ncbi:MAG TPA: hypothetical protein VLQ93_16825 [Myxococcaceae bacterium]|nr:hypothetical protein [Myxococcaceae bacterium]
MRRTRRERGLAHGQEKDRLLVKLFEAQASYAELKRALLELEKRWLREARTPAERLAVRRTIAQDLVSEAYSFGVPWKEFGPARRRVQRLGFSNLAMRFHIASLSVQSLHLFPGRAPEAWALLDDTRRRLLRLRRGHFLRREGLEALAAAEREAPVPRPSGASHREGVRHFVRARQGRPRGAPEVR